MNALAWTVFWKFHWRHCQSWNAARGAFLHLYLEPPRSDTRCNVRNEMHCGRYELHSQTSWFCCFICILVILFDTNCFHYSTKYIVIVPETSDAVDKRLVSFFLSAVHACVHAHTHIKTHTHTRSVIYIHFMKNIHIQLFINLQFVLFWGSLITLNWIKWFPLTYSIEVVLTFFHGKYLYSTLSTLKLTPRYICTSHNGLTLCRSFAACIRSQLSRYVCLHWWMAQVSLLV